MVEKDFVGLNLVEVILHGQDKFSFLFLFPFSSFLFLFVTRTEIGLGNIYVFASKPSLFMNMTMGRKFPSLFFYFFLKPRKFLL